MKANPEAEAEEPEQRPEQPDEPEAAAAAGEPAESGEPGAQRQPEEPDTERLERAVRAAETALIEFEIAVETFRVEIENFSRLHHQRLGPMYARLDELDASILEVTAAISGDPEDLRKAHEARAAVLPMPKVEELFHGWIDSEGLSPEATAMLTGQNVQPPSRVRPSEEARKAYRELVRKAHPDLAQEDAERQRREEFLVRVNKAYAEGDADALRDLLEEWEKGPREEEPEPRVPHSELLYARLEWLAERKEVLTAMVAEMEESAIGAMLRMAPDDPDRLLEEIAEQLLEQVAERESELARLVQIRDAGAAGTGERAGAGTGDGDAGAAGAGAEEN
ncbi:J domain-containing protein [Streptomyces winkii]|uniref:J domain-containing protein n=1 Tax=Streptomyces winkii TaxID=3051178 RepID=UPI0028D0A893|nr:J domain-containing protein [Streptomyces sp. DSM 40971]